MVRKRRKLQPPRANATSRILQTAGKQGTNHLSPHFSFAKLQAGYCIQDCSREEKAALADCLRIYSRLTWQEIIQNHKHKNGFEKIQLKFINAPRPKEFTEEESEVTVLRFCGFKPMLGIRIGRLMDVYWLDPKMNLYDHGP